MNTKELFLAPECLGVQIELVDVTADYYGDSRERQAQPVGYRYSVLLREHASDKIVVKIAGPQQMEAPVSGAGVMVRFNELRVRPYVNRATGQLAYSATATGIKPAAGPDAPVQAANRKS